MKSIPYSCFTSNALGCTQAVAVSAWDERSRHSRSGFLRPDLGYLSLVSSLSLFNGSVASGPTRFSALRSLLSLAGDFVELFIRSAALSAVEISSSTAVFVHVPGDLCQGSSIANVPLQERANDFLIYRIDLDCTKGLTGFAKPQSNRFKLSDQWLTTQKSSDPAPSVQGKMRSLLSNDSSQSGAFGQTQGNLAVVNSIGNQEGFLNPFWLFLRFITTSAGLTKSLTARPTKALHVINSY